ncbi:hypothetical protein BJY00DRAFT_234939 [Aspergillus carlsbadensis]|nr:hypothetical protein BJY00DRAFT_234939 [Aspergillus carlsbadensis]
MAKDTQAKRDINESDDVYTLGSTDDDAQPQPERQRQPRRHDPAATQTRTRRTVQRGKRPNGLTESNASPNESSALQPLEKGQTHQMSRNEKSPSAMRIQGGPERGIHEAPKKKEDTGLKLRLDLNLDIEVELKAKIYGDLTLALLS